MRIPVSQLIGSPVRNDQGENLGAIDDLLVDLKDGEVCYAVVSFGGVLGFRSKYIAVPLPLLQMSKDGKCLLSETRIALQQAPGFNKGKWPDCANDTQLEIVKRYNEVKPAKRAAR